MKNPPIFAIDFEGSRTLGIVEYGVAEIVDFKIESLKCRICSPKADIPKRDADFFGITTKQTSGEKPFFDDIAMFCQMRSRGIFAAHSAKTEDSLLRDALPTPGIVPSFSRTCSSWAPWIDTCRLYKTLYPELKDLKLFQLIGTFGLQGELDDMASNFCPGNRRGWHRAPYDALACALLIIFLSRQKGFENVEAEWLAKYGGNPNVGQETLL